jgi:hypothetical protein
LPLPPALEPHSRCACDVSDLPGSGATGAWQFWARDDTQFMAGNLPTAIPFWKDVLIPAAGLTSPESETILSWLAGVDVSSFFKPFKGEFAGRMYDAPEPPPYMAHNHPVPLELRPFVDTTIADGVRAGSMKAVAERPKVVLPLGVALNAAGKPRVILDARYLNLWTPSPPMSYEGLKSFRYGVAKGDYLITIDHKSGYHHVPLTENSWTFVGFRWRGQYYVFMVLPFGWAPACFIYNALSTTLAAYLRTLGLHVIVYLDDFGIVLKCEWPEKVKGLYTALVLMIKFLAGYYVSRTKSNLSWNTTAQLLGFGIDTVRQLFFVPEKKLEVIFALITEVLDTTNGRFPLQKFQSLCGKVQALSLAVPPVSLFLREAYDLLARANLSDAPFVTVTAKLKSELRMLFQLRRWERLSHWKKERHIRLYTDASSFAWGAVLYLDDETRRANGAFPVHQAGLHINIKEFIAVAQALSAFRGCIPPCYLEIYVDNTAVQYSALRGSSPDELARALSRHLLQWQLYHNVTIRFHRVPSKENIADAESRLPGLRGGQPPVLERGDHRLNPRLFHSLQSRMQQRFTIDACANPRNTQTPRFIARDWWPHPGCVAADVLSYSFPPLPDGRCEFIYCNPPWTILAPVWVHFRQCRAAGALVFPWQPRKPWFGMIMAQAKSVGVLARRGDASVFLQPSRNYMASVGPVRWDVGYAIFDFR